MRSAGTMKVRSITSVSVGTAMYQSTMRECLKTFRFLTTACIEGDFYRCYWCQLAYNLDTFYSGPSDKDGCSSAGVSIAPIPSSVLALEASYNQTYTGIISGAASATTGPPASVAASSTGSAQLALTSKASLSIQRTIGSPSNNGVNTYFGGVTSVVTLNGGNQGTATAALISNTGNSEATVTSTTKAGSSAGGALGWTTGTVVMLSVVAFRVSILCLL